MLENKRWFQLESLRSLPWYSHTLLMNFKSIALSSGLRMQNGDLICVLLAPVIGFWRYFNDTHGRFRNRLCRPIRLH